MRQEKADAIVNALLPDIELLPRELRKLLSVYISEDMISRGCEQQQATSQAAALILVSERSVRRWSDDFWENGFYFSLSLRGHHAKVQWALEDVHMQARAKQYVREHLNVKGQPNLTGQSFALWVGKTLLKDQVVDEKTARRWLKKLGFRYVKHRLTMYFDGHERPDVVLARLAYLREKKIHDETTLHIFGALSSVTFFPIYIEIIHDECVCNTNADQSSAWVEGTAHLPLKPKSLGKGLMISAFLTEHHGIIHYELLEFGGGNWWDSDKLLEQTKKVIEVAKKLYLGATLIFRFDNAPSHRKVAEDVPKVNRRRVRLQSLPMKRGSKGDESHSNRERSGCYWYAQGRPSRGLT